MFSLSDQLKSLGVKVGARDLMPQKSTDAYAIERVIPGRVVETGGGASYVVETAYPADYIHGHRTLEFPSDFGAIAAWAGESRLNGVSPQAFACLDIETTGLRDGPGTYAFLVGVGRFWDGVFHVAQFFMRDPLEEPPHLLALEQFLAPCQALITYNGKSFDVPLLTTRYLTQGWRSPLADLAHVDLLHLARRLWRDRLPSRMLGDIEVAILGHRRTQEDIPGWLVPQMYFDYLHTGDARPLTGVFYHNAMDVVSLAALFSHVARLLENPLQASIEHDVDWLALGRHFDRLDQSEIAAALYRRALQGELPAESREEALWRLATLHKRRGAPEQAIALWVEAAAHGRIEAFVELAKWYEHERHEPAIALHWTQIALERLQAPQHALQRVQWQAELEHRQARLMRKVAHPV